MFSITYTNANGHSVSMGKSAPFYYLSQQGMDGVSADALLVKSPFQRGQTGLGANVDARVVTVRGCLVTEDLGAFEAYRAALLRALDPFVPGTMRVRGETFERAFRNVQIVEAPAFDDRDHNRPDGIVYFNFTALVPGNFAEDVDWNLFPLAEVEPLFAFPLEFDMGTNSGTIEFGNMTVGRVAIFNGGDVPAPVVIHIPGPVETPMIVNETTGEFVRVHTPILANEVMRIDTAFGRKTVEIACETGHVRNAFHYIDMDSTFFQLLPGENVLRFTAEAGNDTAGATVRYRRLYLGL